MDAAARARCVADHLGQIPQDARYVELLQQGQEFSPHDRNYDAWFRYNLYGIERGEQLIAKLGRLTGSIQGLNVLDIGAGGGGNAIACARHGCAVTAIEIEPIRLQWLRTRVRDHGLPITVFGDPIEKLNFDQRFDLVLCNAVLEHVEDWRSFLGHVLQAGKGFLYLSWPNRYSLTEVISDQHYGLFGAVFFTGRLFPLQKHYTRLLGIRRDAWVRAIPSLATVTRVIARQWPGCSITQLPPDGIEKLADPAGINNAMVRKAVTGMKALGLSDSALRRLVIFQRKEVEVLIARQGPDAHQ